MAPIGHTYVQFPHATHLFGLIFMRSTAPAASLYCTLTGGRMAQNLLPRPARRLIGAQGCRMIAVRAAAAAALLRPIAPPRAHRTTPELAAAVFEHLSTVDQRKRSSRVFFNSHG